MTLSEREIHEGLHSLVAKGLATMKVVNGEEIFSLTEEGFKECEERWPKDSQQDTDRS